VPGHVDVDPAEPRGEGRRRRRDDDQPVVAVDQADDLAQHGNQVVVSQPVGVVDAHREVRVPAPQPDELLAVVQPQYGDAGRPGNEADVPR
jgi:hypothetical protein